VQQLLAAALQVDVVADVQLKELLELLQSKQDNSMLALRACRRHI
jgi:hypothetical protein